MKAKKVSGCSPERQKMVQVITMKGLTPQSLTEKSNGPAKCGISLSVTTQNGEADMVWNKAIQEQYKRPSGWIRK